VLIPRWVMALPTSLRRYVLCHEEEHRRARDVLLLFIASIPLIMTPWNLALWWHFRRLSLAVELDCDNRVVAALGNPKVYGELLYKVAQASSAGPRLQPGFLGGRGMLERRLSRLLEPVQISRLERVLLPTIAIALLVVALLSPHPVSDTRVAAKHASANHTVRP
jgi:bla regulator protein BlaR1